LERDWLFADLFYFLHFYMKGWYCKGYDKNGISTGDAKGSSAFNNRIFCRLPMIPLNMLVIRNVSISRSTWGSDGNLLGA
jgi:hypothetical protein